MRKTKVTIIILTVLVMWLAFNFYSDKNLHIYFLNVGQGDSILIQTPDYKTILIDGGPNDSVLSELNNALPFWVKKLDLVILTHPDADHITGLVEVIKYYDIGEIIFGAVNKNTNIYREFLTTIKDENIRNQELRSDDDFIFGCCLYIDVLWPEEGVDLNSIKPVNNVSFSILLIYKDFEIILAGDNESASELKITQNNNIPADILKVSHHGSNTSSIPEFLDEVNPEVAIIQVGKDNKFGHPTVETLQKLNERNIRIYRNDLNGRIQLKTDGYSYTIACEFNC